MKVEVVLQFLLANEAIAIFIDVDANIAGTFPPQVLFQALLFLNHLSVFGEHLVDFAQLFRDLVPLVRSAGCQSAVEIY